ncbi:hypothetical protein [Dyadobacter fanqingshengii]|uniref:Uncharacterized protein n=1 Tax=Dyadobacter fanqingshengii TaxID=2906443 RepID=A0A9X1PB40_9BACT|nr:hypothetical protein [Dyadobacter fanqingshengii]MCF0040200.1 hypothetical protein [Dyadobacter fanqingshengii]USJ38051.1 hypothetical protein NFI81_09735 [Dyadobacter fanqingshengii]
MKSGSALLIAFCASLSGCLPKPDFDSVPRIEYASIVQSPESDPLTGKKLQENVVITVTFEDKDGDLGATADERSDETFNSIYGKRGNYELVTLTKNVDGSWDERILSSDSTMWMPVLKPDGKAGPIKGKLDYELKKPYGNNSVNIEQKFKVRIRDRALHYSNQVETDIVTVPGYR